MISTRYLLPISILLLFALVPTVIHSYLGLTKNDGRTVSHINAVLNGINSIPSNRLPIWGQETFDSYDWLERFYRDDQGHNVRLFVGRSFDHKRLYHHPELALSYARDLGDQTIQLLPGNPAITVTVLKNPTKNGLAAYALVYDDKFIDNPIIHQLHDSLHLLIGARKPMTLFYVADDSFPRDAPFDQSTAAKILASAVNDFLSQ